MTETYPDIPLLLLARGLRAVGGGALSVALALDLSRTYSNLLAGLFLGIAMGAGSAWSLAAGTLERQFGRRSTFLISSGAFTIGGFLLFGWQGSIYAVLTALLLGGILAGSSDIGTLPSLEQAAIGAVATDVNRTQTFSQYNLVGYLGSALGALLAAPLTAFGGEFLPANNDLVLLLYGLLGISLIPVYARLSGAADWRPRTSPGRALSASTRPQILLLSGLFSVDAFGGGLVANFLVTLWLHARFSASGYDIGIILALALVGAAASLVLAAPLARRIGLVNTMVFTHLPSSVLLVLFAFAPTFSLAGALWVARSLLSQMDVPTRQSLVQGIVAPEERTAAAGYTTAARSTSALGGPVTGAFLEFGGPWLAAPFALAGATKILYDLTLFAKFRKLRTREEAMVLDNGPPRRKG